MAQKKKYAVINGYGVPKDIFSDKSYHAYLVGVFNFLWTKYANQSVVLIPAGGLTDMQKPYRRTEAGEIKKWLYKKKVEHKLRNWEIRPVATEYTALENMFAVKKITRTNPVIYFCEKSREQKMNVLVRKIFPRSKVVAIEFDGSPARYDIRTRKALEREDLKFSLLALKDSVWRKQLHEAAKEKIRVLRTLSPAQRAKEVDRIARDIRKKFYLRYTK